MEETALTARRRPILITIVSIWIFIAVVLMVIGLLIPAARNLAIAQYGNSTIPVALISMVLDVVGLAGYWRMRRFGIYACAAVAR